MSLSFVLDPELTADLRDHILALWVDVTNAGGAVGFVAPVSARDVRPTAERALADVRDGAGHLLAGFDGDELVALLFITGNRHRLKDHWRVLKRVMVTPGRQGRGYGAAIMREAAGAGRKLGVEALVVTVRGGTGRERFYERLGYREVGRIPGALRVAPGDDRDEIYLWLSLV
jgi:GNAT superfamily N-acetyltransferase